MHGQMLQKVCLTDTCAKPAPIYSRPRKMTFAQRTLLQLLRQPNRSWLTWHRDLTEDSSRSDQDTVFARVLRSLTATANSLRGGAGYVVYGVDDTTTPRRVVGVSAPFLTRQFRSWSANIIRPGLQYQSEELFSDHKRVLLFQLQPSPESPHVCHVSKAGVLTEGQVWIRHRGECAVAKAEELRELCEPHRPVVLSYADGPLVRQVRDLWSPLGWEPFWPSQSEKARHLESGCLVAFQPGTRREIQFADSVLLLRRSREQAVPLHVESH